MSFPIALAGSRIKRGGGSCPSYTPGLYTAEQIDDLVNIDGYIPVATAAEFDLIDSPTTQTMGAGTCWEGTYNTGEGEKYVQINDITFTSSFGRLNVDGTVYDGNNFSLNDVLNGAFSSTTPSTEIKNLTINIDASAPITANLLTISNEGLIDNCAVVGDVSGLSGATFSLMCANNGTALNPGTIRNSYVNGTISGEISNSGLFISNATGIIENCYAVGSITSTNSGSAIGGFFGISNNDLIITKCYADVTVSGGRFCGGFFGTIRQSGKTASISECYASGSVTGVDGLVSATGGFGGFTRDTSVVVSDSYASGNVVGQGLRSAGFISDAYNILTMVNCYCANSVTGATTNAGLVAFNQAGSTYTNCYWDTDIGPATSAGGTGQTTSALQTPTSNTGIYSTWDASKWNFGTSSDYPNLINTP